MSTESEFQIRPPIPLDIVLKESLRTKYLPNYRCPSQNPSQDPPRFLIEPWTIKDRDVLDFYYWVLIRGVVLSISNRPKCRCLNEAEAVNAI